MTATLSWVASRLRLRQHCLFLSSAAPSMEMVCLSWPQTQSSSLPRRSSPLLPRPASIPLSRPCSLPVSRTVSSTAALRTLLSPLPQASSTVTPTLRCLLLGPSPLAAQGSPPQRRRLFSTTSLLAAGFPLPPVLCPTVPTAPALVSRRRRPRPTSSPRR